MHLYRVHRMSFPLLTGLCLGILGNAATASSNADTTAAVNAARTFATEATREWGTRATITVENPAPGIAFPPCARHEVFLPAESRLWGKTRVGVKCSAPSAWLAYMPVTVAVAGQYFVTAKKINRGQSITESDVAQAEGDLTLVPDTVIRERQQVIGQRSKVSLLPGLALRREHLILPPVIKQGEKVRILVRGSAFSVAAEGMALHDAAEGESMKVRNSTGKTLSGIARRGGEVELNP